MIFNSILAATLYLIYPTVALDSLHELDKVAGLRFVANDIHFGNDTESFALFLCSSQLSNPYVGHNLHPTPCVLICRIKREHFKSSKLSSYAHDPLLRKRLGQISVTYSETKVDSHLRKRLVLHVRILIDCRTTKVAKFYNEDGTAQRLVENRFLHGLLIQLSLDKSSEARSDAVAVTANVTYCCSRETSSEHRFQQWLPLWLQDQGGRQLHAISAKRMTTSFSNGVARSHFIFRKHFHKEVGSYTVNFVFIRRAAPIINCSVEIPPISKIQERKAVFPLLREVRQVSSSECTIYVEFVVDSDQEFAGNVRDTENLFRNEEVTAVCTGRCRERDLHLRLTSPDGKNDTAMETFNGTEYTFARAKIPFKVKDCSFYGKNFICSLINHHDIEDVRVVFQPKFCRPYVKSFLVKEISTTWIEAICAIEYPFQNIDEQHGISENEKLVWTKRTERFKDVLGTKFLHATIRLPYRNCPNLYHRRIWCWSALPNENYTSIKHLRVPEHLCKERTIFAQFYCVVFFPLFVIFAFTYLGSLVFPIAKAFRISDRSDRISDRISVAKI